MSHTLKEAVVELKDGVPVSVVFWRPAGMKFSPVERCQLWA